MKLLGKNLNSQVAIDHLDYRGYSIDFFEDPIGRQLFTVFQGSPIYFGTDNTMYKDDMIKVVDDHLDTITRFENNSDINCAKLTWFNNGGFRDIKLMHWNRILKIYLIEDSTKIDYAKLCEDAENILLTLLDTETAS